MLKSLLLGFFILGFAGAAAAQDTVLFIRHAEKADGPDPALTDEGRARAAAWAEMLRDTGIAAIVTSQARRTRETGTIIAAALSVPLSDWPADDSVGLIDMLSFDFEGQVVLVVGHTETIPSLLRQIGVSTEMEIAATAFDNLFVVSGIESGQPRLVRLHMP